MELKDALKLKKKVLIGRNQTEKAIREDKIKEVFVCSNYPDELLQKLNNAAKASKFTLNKLKLNSEELGAQCRRPYSVAIIGVLK